MIINHNISALDTYRHLTITQSEIANALEKLSSGLRINKAADDAAGLAISEKMRAQIKGLNQAARNAQDGISLVQTAEGAMDELHAILQRMRELAIEAANDTNTAFEREQIQKEIDQLKAEVDHIAYYAQFNTRKLLSGNLSYNLLKTTGDASIDKLSADSRTEAGLYQVGIYQAADEAELVGGTAFLVSSAASMEGNTAAVLHTGTITINGVAIHLDSDEYHSASDKLQYIIDKINEKTSQTNVKAEKYKDPYDSNIQHLRLVQLDTGTDNKIVLGGDEQTLKDIGFGLRKGYQGNSITTSTWDRVTFTASGDIFINNVNVFHVTAGVSYTLQSLAKIINDKAYLTGVRAEAIEISVVPGVHKWRFRLVEEIPGIGIDTRNTTASIWSQLGVSVANLDLDEIPSLGNTDTGVRWYEGNNEGTSLFAASIGERIRINGNWIDIRNAKSLVSIADIINQAYQITNVKAEVVGAEISGHARLRLYQVTADTRNKIIMYANDNGSSGGGLDKMGFGMPDKTAIIDRNGGGARYTTGVNVKIRVYSADETGHHISIADDDALIIEGKGNRVTLDKKQVGQHIYTPLNYDYTKRGMGLAMDIYGENTPWYAPRNFTVGTVNLWGSGAEIKVMSDNTLLFHIGANADETLRIDIDPVSADALGISNVDVTTHGNAELAIDAVSEAINKVSEQRAKLGAYQNRLEHTIKSLNVSAENLQAAESRIRDVDMAQEMMVYTKLQILNQAGTAMLAQANTLPQSVLQLLRG